MTQPVLMEQPTAPPPSEQQDTPSRLRRKSSKASRRGSASSSTMNANAHHGSAKQKLDDDSGKNNKIVLPSNAPRTGTSNGRRRISASDPNYHHHNPHHKSSGMSSSTKSPHERRRLRRIKSVDGDGTGSVNGDNDNSSAKQKSSLRRAKSADATTATNTSNLSAANNTTCATIHEQQSPTKQKSQDEPISSLESSLRGLKSLQIIGDNAGSRLLKAEDDDNGSCVLSVAELSQSALSINSKAAEEEANRQSPTPPSFALTSNGPRPSRRASLSNTTGLEWKLPQSNSMDETDDARSVHSSASSKLRRPKRRASIGEIPQSPRPPDKETPQKSLLQPSREELNQQQRRPSSSRLKKSPSRERATRTSRRESTTRASSRSRSRSQSRESRSGQQTSTSGSSSRPRSASRDSRARSRSRPSSSSKRHGRKEMGDHSAGSRYSVSSRRSSSRRQHRNNNHDSTPAMMAMKDSSLQQSQSQSQSMASSRTATRETSIKDHTRRTEDHTRRSATISSEDHSRRSSTANDKDAPIKDNTRRSASERDTTTTTLSSMKDSSNDSSKSRSPGRRRLHRTRSKSASKQRVMEDASEKRRPSRARSGFSRTESERRSFRKSGGGIQRHRSPSANNAKNRHEQNQNEDGGEEDNNQSHVTPPGEETSETQAANKQTRSVPARTRSGASLSGGRHRATAITMRSTSASTCRDSTPSTSTSGPPPTSTNFNWRASRLLADQDTSTSTGTGSGAGTNNNNNNNNTNREPVARTQSSSSNASSAVRPRRNSLSSSVATPMGDSSQQRRRRRSISRRRGDNKEIEEKRGETVQASLDQSLNSLLSAYNNTPSDQPPLGRRNGLSGQDSFSTTNSDMDSTQNSVMDASSASAVDGKKKKKKSLASRVKSIVGRNKDKDSSSNKKDKKDDSSGKKDKDNKEDLVRQGSFSTINTSMTAAGDEHLTSGMDESISQHPNGGGGKGVGSKIRRVGRRLSLKGNKIERPDTDAMIYDNTIDLDDNASKCDAPSTTKNESGSKQPSKSKSKETSKNTTPEREDDGMDGEDHNKKGDKESNDTGLDSYVKSSSRKSKKAKIASLARGLTGRKSKTTGMEKLQDSFGSLGTVDRAILKTNETMQQALKEFGLEADDDGELLPSLELNENLELDDDIDLDGLLMDDDPTLQLNLMKSFAQLDFGGMGIDDEGECPDDTTDAVMKSQSMTNACLANSTKPQLVVRRNRGTQPKKVDPGDDTVASSTRKSSMRRKKPTRSQTESAAKTIEGAEPFDWEKHAVRRRRSKSLTALRATAQLQKQKQRGLPKNPPRNGFGNLDRLKTLEGSEGSFDASVLSGSVEAERQTVDRSGSSSPAILHHSRGTQQVQVQ